MQRERKIIAVAELRAALEQLPANFQLLVNSEGNLAVLDAQCNYVAWIRLGQGEGEVLRWCTGDTHDARRFARRRERMLRKAGLRVLNGSG